MTPKRSRAWRPRGSEVKGRRWKTGDGRSNHSAFLLVVSGRRSLAFLLVVSGRRSERSLTLSGLAKTEKTEETEARAGASVLQN